MLSFEHTNVGSVSCRADETKRLENKSINQKIIMIENVTHQIHWKVLGYLGLLN